MPPKQYSIGDATGAPCAGRQRHVDFRISVFSCFLQKFEKRNGGGLAHSQKHEIYVESSSEF
jgi:hypothetical protein